MTTFQKQQLAGLVFLFLLVAWLIIVFGFHLLDSQSAVAQWGIAGQLFVCGLILMMPFKSEDFAFFLLGIFLLLSATLIVIFVPDQPVRGLEMVTVVFSGIFSFFAGVFTFA